VPHPLIRQLKRQPLPHPGDEMPNQIVCFVLGVIAPLASIGWLIAYH
jgi:hypothetical protein